MTIFDVLTKEFEREDKEKILELVSNKNNDVEVQIAIDIYFGKLRKEKEVAEKSKLDR